jgi:hypothetical protein
MRRPQDWQMVKLMLSSRRCAGGGYGNTLIRTRQSAGRSTSSVVPGHSPSKTGVNALMFRASTPFFLKSVEASRGWPGQARP